jgi:hypothetical protein
MRTCLIVALLFISIANISYAKEVPFTLDDRERMVRVEVKVEEGLKAVNQKVDDGLRSVNQRIDFLQNIMLGGFGVLFSGMIALVGFILWDRRSTLAPVVRKNKELEEDLLIALRRTRELEEREATIEKALREYAEQDSRLKEILRGVRLL